MLTGFDNWKKTHQRFRQHAKTNAHIESAQKIRQLAAPGINSLFSNQVRSEQEFHRRMLHIQLSSLRYLGLAIRGHEELEGNLMQLFTSSC